MNCWTHDRTFGGSWTGPVPAVAIYVTQPSGTEVPLCTPCLNAWLDNADDSPEMEPSAVRWLAAAPSASDTGAGT